MAMILQYLANTQIAGLHMIFWVIYSNNNNHSKNIDITN